MGDFNFGDQGNEQKVLPATAHDYGNGQPPTYNPEENILASQTGSDEKPRRLGRIMSFNQKTPAEYTWTKLSSSDHYPIQIKLIH